MRRFPDPEVSKLSDCLYLKQRRKLIRDREGKRSLKISLSKAIGALILISYFVCLLPGVSPGFGAGPGAVLSSLMLDRGIPNAPGYPVYGMLSQFILDLFASHHVYILNCLAAGLTALTLFVFFLTLKLWAFEILQIPKTTYHEFLCYFLSFSPLFSETVLRHSYFAERYILASLAFFLMLHILTKVSLGRTHRKTDWIAVSALMSLSFYIHFNLIPIMAVMGIITCGLLWRAHRRTPWIAVLGTSLMCLTLPALWLVWKSQQNPFFNWGDPSNLERLAYVLTRGEKAGYSLSRPWVEWTHQWARQYEFLFSQFSFWPALGLLSVAALLRRRPWWGVIWISMILLSGEFATWTINFSGTGKSPVFQDYLRWQMQNYYLLFYFATAFLMSLGALCSAKLLLERVSAPALKKSLTATFALLFGFGLVHSLGKNEASQQNLIEEYIQNIEKVTPEGSVIFTNMDFLYFPAEHFKRRGLYLQNRSLFHVNLMTFSWYWKSLLEENDPAISPYRDQIEDLRRDLVRFELDPKANKSEIYEKFLRILDLIAGRHQPANRKVFLIFLQDLSDLPTWSLGAFRQLPVIWAYELSEEFGEIRTLPSTFEISSLQVGLSRNDYWARVIATLAVRNARQRIPLLAPEPKQRIELQEFLKSISDEKIYP